MARARASACGGLLRNRVWRAIESARGLGEGVSEDAVPGSLPVRVPCRLASGLFSLGAAFCHGGWRCVVPWASRVLLDYYYT